MLIYVELGAKKILSNFTEDEINIIKAELTLKNPAYEMAERYSPYAKIALPKTLSYYEYVGNKIAVPRGYNIPFETKIISDNRFENKVKFRKLRLTPRDMQIEAINSFDGNDDGMLISPTASGKSVMALMLAERICQKTLIIVHKDDLVSGWTNDIQKCFPGRVGETGLIKAHIYRIGKWITISTIQTLSKLPKEKMEELKNTFGLIIADELHHVAAKIWKITGEFPAKYRIGVTATPIRNDGLGKVLEFYFGKPCFIYKESEKNKDIIPPSKVFIRRQISGVKYYQPTLYIDSRSGKVISKININGVWKNIKELYPEELNKLLAEKKLKKKSLDYHLIREAINNDKYFVKQICSNVKDEFSKNKSCLVFCFAKDFCREIFSTLEQMGVPKEKMQLYYGDSKESKEEMRIKCDSKEVLITIATYAIATEGSNLRAIERIFLADTIGNAKDTIQAIGRGRRTFPGKENLIVYDYTHPNVVGVKSHWNVREKVYKEIGFKIN